MNQEQIRRRVRFLLIFFIVVLTLSGLSAFPLRAEIDILNGIIGNGTFMEETWPAMAHWISHVDEGIGAVDKAYPFLFYGTDWLAFAHLIIAIAFIGPLRDPVKNIWVVETGMIACALIVPLALICGPIRGIPFFWTVIDCLFGIIGIIPLWFIRSYTLQLADLCHAGS